ncbi:MAG: hypothetical protein GY796_05150 [Chloroflexi bacterium]|nr:hypothetical protein [Chloroflexota bacterium]
MKENGGLLLLTALSLLAYGGMVRMQWLYGTLRDGRTPQTIAWYLLAFLAYLGAILWAEKRGISLRWLWGTAVIFRLLLLFTTPTLSDDVYRYLWDGYVTNQGISPYAYAINSPELDSLDIPQRTQANNAWMASPYLPAAQIVFGGVTAVFPLQSIFLQIIMLLFDLLNAWLLSRLLTLALLPPRRLLLYLWNPLVIVEVAHSAHIDAWMLLLTLLAIYLTLKPYPHTNQTAQHKLKTVNCLSPLFLTLATLTKPLPVLLSPILFWHWTWVQRILYGLLTLILLIPFGLQAGWGLSGELDGTGLFGALRIYGRQWNFNSGPFHWLELYLGQRGLPDPADTGKLIIGGVMVVVLTAVFLLARTRTAPRVTLRLMSLPLIGYVLLTPTLHPWYTLILLAFLPFLPPAEGESNWRWLLAAPWIYLSGALIFSYLTYLDPLNFGELEWVRHLEWLPTLTLLLLATLAAIRKIWNKMWINAEQTNS